MTYIHMRLKSFNPKIPSPINDVVMYYRILILVEIVTLIPIKIKEEL